MSKVSVFKFGGASIKDAEGFKNVAGIIQSYNHGNNLMVIVSALGKTTNALEKFVDAYFEKGDATGLLMKVKSDHLLIAEQLIADTSNKIFTDLNNLFVEADWLLEDDPHDEYDYVYDQIVSIGELASTKILAAYMQSEKINVKWLDVRDLIATDETWREGKVDWHLTEKNISEKVLPVLQNQIVLTQGFLGGTLNNQTTTLGREGSDYSAAIFSYCLNADSQTIWKDVAGVLNADPRYFASTQKIDQLSYHEAIEMTFFGATVIHPKTIKPLQNKHIPLHVKSFLQPKQIGTVISDHSQEVLPPVLVLKTNQVLLSISAIDFSFIAEENLSHIFSLFARHQSKMNLMQNAAISFSVSIDYSKTKTEALINELQQHYKVLHNDGLELLTIRHYTNEVLHEFTEGRKIFLEQKSRHTVQLVMNSQI